MTSPAERRVATVASAACALAAALAPWAFGATEPSWAALLAICCLVPFLLGAVAQTFLGGPSIPRETALAAVAVVVVPAAGLVPAPLWLRQILVPGGTTLMRETSPVEADSMRALSLSPSSTLEALWLAAAFAATYLLLARQAAARRSVVLLPLLLSAAALAVFGMVQNASQAGEQHPRIYWKFEIYEAATPFGPYVNRNHFGGAMILLAAIAAGEALALRAEGRRLLAAACVLVCGVTAFALAMTTSKGAIGAAGVAVAALVVGARRGGRIRAFLVVAGAAVLVIALLAFTGTLDRILERFGHFNARWVNRFGIQRDALGAWWANPWIGTGAGTFAETIPPYQRVCDIRSFSNGHSDWTQLLMETGLLGAAAVALVLRPVLRWWRRAADAAPAVRWRIAGPLAGVAGIAAHGLVEVNLHVPANALLTVCALSLASAAAAPPSAENV